MKKIILLFLLLYLALPCAAEEEPTVYTSGNYQYTLLEDGTAMICSYTGNENEPEIPAQLDGRPVTGLHGLAFASRPNIRRLTIPNHITRIDGNPCAGIFSLFFGINVSPDHPVFETIDGVLFNKQDHTLLGYPEELNNSAYAVPAGTLSITDYAFYACQPLTEITLPDSITAIGDFAFGLCTGLTSAVIPDSVTAMGDNPWLGCESLTEIRTSPDQPVFATIDGVLFNKVEKKLISFPIASPITDYEIPQGIRSIGYGAIGDCENLTSVTIPDSVTSIETFAFASCTGLTSVTISGSDTVLAPDVFYDCPSLKTITVPRNSYAAQYCKDNNLPYTYPDANDWLLN